MAENIYFQLTAEFNARGRIAILASGQAVVYYRLAIMSKDGDWIVRESKYACEAILEVLTQHGARYRAGAPLDPRWLSGGWSSHFEFQDPQGRRLRCDFFSRPPRLSTKLVKRLFSDASDSGDTLPLAVVDVPSLIRMKQTQRAKDYPVIGELARLLPPEEELRLTTNPDRILTLAEDYGADSHRLAVQAARKGQGRLAIVQALAFEIDDLQQADRTRMETYARASSGYLQAFRTIGRQELSLPEGHQHLCHLAETLLPQKVTL